jgi:hypothetical protein
MGTEELAPRTESSAPEAEPPALEKNWRYYAGLTALALALVLPLFSFAVPLLGLPAGTSTLIAGALVAGGPDVLGVLAVLLLGKSAVRYFAARTKQAILRAVLAERVSRARHYVGLAVLFTSWLPSWIFAYAPSLAPAGTARIWLLAGADLAFLGSFFILGGEFWQKLRDLVAWAPPRAPEPAR